MKTPVIDTITRQIQLFLVWWHLFKTSFPPLWAAAQQFAPLVLTRCATCDRPKFWFWVPVGDHSQCDNPESDTPPRDPYDD
ncbi:MAG: hypothetical protein ACWGQW_13420, partial [bacterium]